MKAKRYIVFICTLYSVFCVPISAHSLIGIGVRGGGQLFLPTVAQDVNTEAQGNIGGFGAIDVRYTYQGWISDYVSMGFLVGAGFGYGTSGLQGVHTDQYTNIDYLNNPIDYTIDAQYRLADKWMQANASLMLAFCFSNVTLNIGPRLLFPVSAKSDLTIDAARINAYYPTYDVNVTDQLITGVLATPSTQSVPSFIPKYHVLLGAEVGYEWSLTDWTDIGVQAFADVSLWSPQSPNPLTTNPLIQVSPIMGTNEPVPTVTVNTLDGQIAGLRYVDFGLRAYVSFCVTPGGKYRNNFDSSRDTKRHQNRYMWERSRYRNVHNARNARNGRNSRNARNGRGSRNTRSTQRYPHRTR